MTTTDPKLETVDNPRVAVLGVRMQLGINGARRPAVVERTNGAAPRRIQLGISGARRAQFETRVVERAPVEVTSSAEVQDSLLASLGTCPP